ncbi:MAG: hypothetical protein LIO77_01210 [Rikenellaceae bacterium]|nr:hypothetical protein [Rikenellaceae bacterium]
MIRGIIESMKYRKSSLRSREICRSMAGEYGIREPRVYSLLRGDKARNSTEMKILYRLAQLGVIWKIKSR